MTDFFWVNGTGTWTNAVAASTSSPGWALTSGGPAITVGGAGVAWPATGDQALLDANSGAGTVTKAVGGSTVGSINMTGSSVVVDWVSRVITVDTGNVVLASATSANGPSLTFTGTADQTLTTGGALLINIIRGGASGTTQKLILGDDLTLAGGLTLNRAKFDMNGKNFTAANFTSSGATTREFIMGTGIMILTNTWTQTATTGFTLSSPGLLRMEASSTGGFTVVAGVTLPDTILVSSTGNTFTMDTAAPFTSLRVHHAANTAFTGAVTISIVQALTVNGNFEVITGSSLNATVIKSSVGGTARTFTVSGAAIFHRCTFQDITGAGSIPFVGTVSSSLVSGNTNVVIGNAIASSPLNAMGVGSTV